MLSDATILARIATVMSGTFRIPPGYVITRETASADVNGWDSLSHALFMMAIEAEFHVELPLERMYDLADIGDLVDVITQCTNAPGERA